MKRWYCTTCGDCVLGLAYMRSDDKRKWCLDCSMTSSSGRLTPRWKAPNLEAAKKAEQEALAAQKRAREEYRKWKAQQVAQTIKKAFGVIASAGDRRLLCQDRNTYWH